jgi:hypothetical protein
LTPEVAAAVDEIRRTFPENRVEVEEEDQGGAYVVVHDLEIGERFRPSRTWVGFLIGFQYADADVYPHFTDPELGRADGGALGTGLTRGSWRDRPAVQISRRSNRWNPATDTAAGKLLKVLQWMRSQ